MSVINFTNHDKAVAAQIKRADGYVMRECGGDTLQAGNSRTLKPNRFRRQEELGMLEPSGDALFDNMPLQAYRLQTANATSSTPREKSCPICREHSQDFSRVKRTSKPLIIVQLFRRKSHEVLAANGVGFPAGCTSSWTEDRIAALTRLWAEGWSASQIAERMGSVTRNAVISKARRLGLPTRKGKYRRKAQPSGRAPRKHRRQTPPVHPWRLNLSSSNHPAPPPPTLTVIVGSVPASERLSLLELTENTCRWPIGDPQDANFCFCGCQKSGSGPYCEYHARIAYQPYVPKEK